MITAYGKKIPRETERGRDETKRTYSTIKENAGDREQKEGYLVIIINLHGFVCK
jgi:hypothetical protein